jgi:hypothetical protein
MKKKTKKLQKFHEQVMCISDVILQTSDKLSVKTKLKIEKALNKTVRRMAKNA